MKLFYIPGACSMASHIALNEVEADFSIESVDHEQGKTSSGLEYRSINPKGRVPTLQLNTGETLTEGAAVLQYIADQHPEKILSPAQGSINRARLQEHLNYIASEIHPAFSPLFSTSTEAQQQQAKIEINSKFTYLNTLLSDERSYLVGNQFSVADAYLFVVCHWAVIKDIDLHQWSYLAQFYQHIAQRPSAQAAFKAEGIQ